MIPAFSVFQTPPEPAAIYQTDGFLESTSISAIRPDIYAGPILRSFIAENNSEVIVLESSFFAACRKGEVRIAIVIIMVSNLI